MTQTLIAFRGSQRLATGPAAQIAALLPTAGAGVLVFDAATGRLVDLDLSGGADLTPARAPAPTDAPPAPRGRGRPKLGVTAREVTLLPRHWDWLATQPGGASAALRRLVEQARRTTADADRKRAAQEAAYRAMQALAGDLPGYEEALRALFAGDGAGFAARLAPWPEDLRSFFGDLAAPAFAAPARATPAADIPPDECD